MSMTMQPVTTSDMRTGNLVVDVRDGTRMRTYRIEGWSDVREVIAWLDTRTGVGYLYLVVAVDSTGEIAHRLLTVVGTSRVQRDPSLDR